MSSFELMFTASIIVLAVIMITYYTKTKKRLSKFIFGVGSGIGGLYLISMIVSNMGFQLPINLLTLTVSGILGVPGAVLLLAIMLV